jgi:hypothetical protein
VVKRPHQCGHTTPSFASKPSVSGDASRSLLHASVWICRSSSTLPIVRLAQGSRFGGSLIAQNADGLEIGQDYFKQRPKSVVAGKASHCLNEAKGGLGDHHSGEGARRLSEVEQQGAREVVAAPQAVRHDASKAPLNKRLCITVSASAEN